MVTATGGGWGSPAKRSDAAIQQDLKNGYITAEQAQKFYSSRGA
jgi:N-methylhydantoinase B